MGSVLSNDAQFEITGLNGNSCVDDDVDGSNFWATKETMWLRVSWWILWPAPACSAMTSEDPTDGEWWIVDSASDESAERKKNNLRIETFQMSQLKEPKYSENWHLQVLRTHNKHETRAKYIPFCSALSSSYFFSISFKRTYSSKLINIFAIAVDILYWKKSELGLGGRG